MRQVSLTATKSLAWHSTCDLAELTAWIGARHPRPGMVIGMASKKVTVTLDETQLERIRGLVAAGVAASVSGFVQHAVGVALDDVAGWGAVLAEALQETGGALSDSERTWADEVLGVTQRGGRSAA
jgi:Arc/MetJ-type ribon-helix-helix transcriptional regulator